MGNYERAVAFSSAKAANKPKYVRSVITKDFVCFEPGEVPDLSTCDFGIVTNWASLSKYIAPGEWARARGSTCVCVFASSRVLAWSRGRVVAWSRGRVFGGRCGRLSGC